MRPYLTHLRLSNVRRFGEDVALELPSGPGATIIVAPNGTGKTSLMEALEFALSGKIRRLDDKHLPAFIREGQTEASVTVCFEGRNLTRSVSQAGRVSVDGDLSWLLGVRSSSDVGMLLRLTHLMDQNDRSWFVREDPKEGGLALAALPAVRDTLAASAAMSGTQRALTTEVNKARQEVEKAEASLAKWTELYEQCEVIRQKLQADRPLPKLEVLRETLVEIETELSDDTTLVGSGTDVDTLNGAVAILLERLESGISQVRGKTVDLDKLSPLIEQHAQLLKEASQAHSEQETARQKRDAAQEAITAAAERLRLETEAHGKLRLEKQERQKHNAMLVAHRKAISDQKAAEKRIEETEDQVEKLSKELAVVKSRLEEDDKGFVTLSQITAQEAELERSRTELSAAILALKDWRAAETERTTLLITLGEAKNASTEAEKQLGERKAEYQDHQKELKKLRNELSELTSSTDALRAAVVQVSSHITETDGTCPVCLWEHGKGTLRRQVDKALEAMNPATVALEGRVREAETQLATSLKAVTQAEEAYDAASVLWEARKLKQNQLTERIRQACSSALLSKRTLADADDALQQHESALQAKDEEIRAARSQAPDAGVLRVNHQRHLDERKRLEDSVRKAEAEQVLATASRAQVATQIAVLSKQMESVEAQDEAESIAALMAASNAAGKAEQRVAEQQALLNSANTDLTNVTDALNLKVTAVEQLRERLRTVRSRWSKNGLEDNPAVDVLEKKTMETAGEMRRYEEALRRTKSAQVDLARWSSAAALHVAEAHLKALRGAGEDDQACGNRLRDQHSSVEEEFNHVEAASTALKRLSRALKVRLETFHNTIIDPVIPFQQELLRRIVRNPKFNLTQIDFEQRRNKHFATTLVPLNSKNVPIQYVASEAQITEVQLSLLLALAVKQPWCAWRGLLLDDPTQHHDLIHASAIFDILRDYIADYEFQLILATHDGNQAGFLERKLRNDGLPTRVYRLVGGQNGVGIRASGADFLGEPMAG